MTPFLEAQGLAMRYGERVVLDGLAFALGRGEVLGLLGPNGAGKTTAFHVVTGLLAPQAGELLLEGARIAPGDRRLRRRMGVVFQQPSLDQKLSARENLLLAAALFGITGAAARDRADRMLAFAELADRAGDQAGKLSGGMRRRLELARALVHRPALLVMDEPTTGLDEASFQRAWDRLLALRQDEGTTILLTTHRPEEAERCDRLAVLERGKVVACETPERLRERVSGDVLTIEPAPGLAAADVAATLKDRFSVDAAVRDGRVVLEHARGHELVPRVVEAFPPGGLRSVSMRRPSLADAFVKLTGRALENDA